MVLRTAANLALVLLSAGPAFAVTYGDIEVTVESEPKGRSDHGYAELWLRIANRSKTAPHAVTVSFPRGAYFSSQDHLRSAARTVAVEPGQVAVVPLTYPERLLFQGNGVGVAVDGRGQDDAVPVSIAGRGYGSSIYHSPTSPAMPDPVLVLYSLSVDTRFPDWVRAARTGVATPPPPGPSRIVPVPGGGFTTAPAIGTIPADAGCVRADRPASDWSPNWVGYTRYDGVVVTADDLRAMPAEVRNAVGQYVECGGTLLVLGPNPQLPGTWKPLRPVESRLASGTAGFGQYFVTDLTDLWSKWPTPDPMLPLINAWKSTQAPWKSVKSVADANTRFPVVEDIGVPVTGLLALMLLFVLAIGPVNLYVLARMKRKLWLFWTVPAASAVTCLVVFAYTALAEGWTGKARVEGFTLLDESTRRASSLGWAAVYSPLSPRDGLHFAPETEVALQNGESPAGMYGYRRRNSGDALTLDWTRDQHLTSGWVTPRVPTHFAVRKGESRRERMTFAPGPDGKPEAVNGLGADLTELWYADEKGNVFHAKDVPAGGRAVLLPTPKATPDPGVVLPTLRNIYGSDWSDFITRMKTGGPALLLTPRSYLALMDSAPFFDEVLSGKADRKAKQAVLGLLPPAGKDGAK